MSSRTPIRTSSAPSGGSRGSNTCAGTRGSFGATYSFAALQIMPLSTMRELSFRGSSNGISGNTPSCYRMLLHGKREDPEVTALGALAFKATSVAHERECRSSPSPPPHHPIVEESAPVRPDPRRGRHADDLPVHGEHHARHVAGRLKASSVTARRVRQAQLLGDFHTDTRYLKWCMPSRLLGPAGHPKYAGQTPATRWSAHRQSPRTTDDQSLSA